MQKLRARSGLSNLIIIGDLNFPEVDWETGHSRHSVDQLFLEMFSNLGLAQLIDKPTHIAGNILDLLLTDNPCLVANIEVDTGWHICKSNHYPITFNVKLRADKRKIPKREIYNFKKANWTAVNDEISSINWAPELCKNTDIE